MANMKIWDFQIKITSAYRKVMFQYVILISSLIFSIFLSYIFDKISYDNQNYYQYYIWPFLYCYLTLSFLYLISPILGIYKKNTYKIVFFITLIPSITWMIFFLYAGFYKFLLQMILTCSVIPIAYWLCWRINLNYWHSK